MLPECTLCFYEFTDADGDHQPACFPCGHVFCFHCLTSLTEPSCPCCRWDPGHNADPDRNKPLIQKLFIPHLSRGDVLDLESLQKEQNEILNNQPVAFTAAQNQEAKTLSDRLRALGVNADVDEAGIKDTIDQVKVWIEGVESIQNVEIKVAIARLLFEVHNVDQKVSINSNLLDKLTRATRENAALRSFNAATLENLRQERETRKEWEQDCDRAVNLVVEERSARLVLQREVEDGRELVSELENRVLSTIQERDDAYIELDAVKKSLKDARRANTTLQSKLEVMQQMLTSERTTLSEYTQSIKRLKAENAKLEEELEENDRHLTRVLTRKKALKSQLHESEKTIENSKDTIVKLRRKADHATEQLDAQREELQKLSQRSKCPGTAGTTPSATSNSYDVFGSRPIGSSKTRAVVTYHFPIFSTSSGDEAADQDIGEDREDRPLVRRLGEASSHETTSIERGYAALLGGSLKRRRNVQLDEQDQTQDYRVDDLQTTSKRQRSNIGS